MTNERQRLSLLSDLPAKKDILDYDTYRDTLVTIIRDLAPEVPLTIGVFGDWGAGKTTLLQMIADELSRPSAVNGTRPAAIPAVWVNAWQLGKEDELWSAFLQALLTKIKDEMRFFRRASYSARLMWRRIDRSKLPSQLLGYGYRILLAIAPVLLTCLIARTQDSTTAVVATIGGGLVSTVLGLWLVVRPFFDAIRSGVSVDLSGLLKESPFEDRVALLDQLKDHFEDMVRSLVGAKGRLAVIIDDLDRCPPDRLVGVLDAIRLFIDSPRCVYLLGLDRDIVEQAVRQKYKGYGDPAQEARDYLEKIVQLPFDLPPLTGEEMEAFVEGLAPELPDPRCAPVFCLGLKPNPRKVKRTINVFLMLWQLSRQREELREAVTPVRLAKVTAIQHGHRELYNHLVLRPGDLGVLEAHFRVGGGERRGLDTAAAVGEVPGAAEAARVLEGPELPERLSEFAGRAMLSRLLTLHSLEEPDANFVTVSEGRLDPLPPLQVRPYITLTRRVTAEKAAAPREAIEPEMVLVPAGEFLMGSTEEEVERLIAKWPDLEEWWRSELPQRRVTLPAYRIGRAPVTNAEYAAFVAATDREPPTHWVQGRFPEELSDHPVVNVSWNDAAAYCDWLTEVWRGEGRIATGEEVRLPSEEEWEKAARGTDGRQYPWGDWEEGRCNTEEAGIGGTTPVGQYSPDGDSPYGCVDMAGNVWEWTATPWERGDPRRVLRGGSWFDLRGRARCAVRDWLSPIYSLNYLGFRCVSPVP